MKFTSIKNSFKYIFPSLLALVIIIILGVSFSWFNYRREGANNKVIAGSLYLTMNDGTDTISLTKAFPLTKEEARSRNDNVITFTINGKNTSSTKDINYEINLNNGDSNSDVNKERFNAKDLVFDLVEIGSNNEEVYILDAVSYNTLNNQKIWVDKISRNTQNEVQKTYKLRMWLSEDVLISDTDPNADYHATGVGSYKNHYASVKVVVEGDLIDRVLPLTVTST